MPEFSVIQNPNLWAEQYRKMNPNWVNGYASIRKKLSAQFKESWNAWRETGEEDKRRRRLQTQLTFASNRLALLGYHDVVAEIVEMFCHDPTAMKGHKFVLEHLALQQHADTLWTIWECIEEAEFPGAGFVRAMQLRALRYLDSDTSGVMGLLDYSLRRRNFGNIEALMATETLLKRSYEPNATESMEFLRRSVELTDVEPRIARNLAMLAGQSRYDLDHSMLNEYLNEAYSFAQSNNGWDRYREEPELTEIRQKYYHSRYPDGPDEFESDYF